MTRTAILSSLLLFAAAVGWLRYPPPLGRDSRSVQSIVTVDGTRRLRERTIPFGCAVLGLAFLVLGWKKRETDPPAV